MFRQRIHPAIGSNAFGLGVNWAHPLSRGLATCLIFGDGLGYDLVTGKPIINNLGAASPNWSATAAGRAGYSTGGSTFAIPNETMTKIGSFRVIFSPVSWPVAFTSPFDSNGRILAAFCTTGGDLNFYGWGDVNTTISISTGMTAGGTWDFAGTNTGTLITWYVNGIAKGTTSFAGNDKTFAGSNWHFGRNVSGGGSDADCKYVTAQLWKGRTLTDGEVMQLYSDPYCFLSPIAINVIAVPPPLKQLMGQIWM